MNHVYIALLILAFLLIELLIGGTRLLFSLPSCGIIALVSFLSLHSFLKLRAKEARWRENIEPSANLKCLMATGAFSKIANS